MTKDSMNREEFDRLCAELKDDFEVHQGKVLTTSRKIVNRVKTRLFKSESLRNRGHSYLLDFFEKNIQASMPKHLLSESYLEDWEEEGADG